MLREYSARDFEEARSLHRQLRALFLSDRPEGSDAEAVQKVRRLCDSALLTIDDDFCQQKICEVDRYAEDHFRADRLRQRIAGMLDAWEIRLATLETRQRSADLVARSKILLGNC